MNRKNLAFGQTESFGQPTQKPGGSLPNGGTEAPSLHPAWQALIRFCREVGHGEIERIRIQDGLPVSAEVVTKKIRWC